jgi:cytoskeletal protein CcmA (bactofilin family)
MFNKDKKNENSKNTQVEIPNREIKEKVAETTNSSKTSLISQGMIIKGEISGTTDIDIYGAFDGTIALEGNNVNIETSAKIKADVNAKTIRVNGSITGNLSASEKILVTGKGSVVGDINAGKIEIQDGGNVDGNISMKKNATKNTSK